MLDSEAEVAALTKELAIECRWFLSAWNRLLEFSVGGDQALTYRPQDAILDGWSIVDEVLIHLVRVDRLLNPDRGHDDDESFATRQIASTRIRALIGSHVLPRGSNRVARNIIEHLNEYIPEFVRKNPGGRLPAVAVGVNPSAQAALSPEPLRSYNTVTGECRVYGETVNLSDASRQVRELVMALPPLVLDHWLRPSVELGERENSGSPTRAAPK